MQKNALPTAASDARSVILIEDEGEYCKVSNQRGQRKIPGRLIGV